MIDELPALRSMAASLAVMSAPVSAFLLGRLTDDLEQGGPVSRMADAHPDRRHAMFPLRLLGGASHAHLSGHAPALVAHLAELDAAGLPPGDETWALYREVLLSGLPAVTQVLDRPVQQHQPDRAARLLRGLTLLGAPKVRLLELGACAGLNLLVDHYRWEGADWSWGPAGSPVRLAARGPRPAEPVIVDRAGCDLAPRDPADPADVRQLCAYIPHEWVHKRAEFTAAMALAAQVKPRVDRADAVAWLRDELQRPAGDGVTTVVWHSMFWPYLEAGQQREIESLLSVAAGRRPLARVSFEAASWLTAPRLQVTLYS